MHQELSSLSGNSSPIIGTPVTPEGDALNPASGQEINRALYEALLAIRLHILDGYAAVIPSQVAAIAQARAVLAKVPA